MKRQLIAFATVLIGLAPAAGLAQPLLVSTPQVVNAGPGDQMDPHVDCTIATYTDRSESNGTVAGIRLFDFANNVDSWLAPDVGAAHLSDVSGSRVAFTHATAANGSQIAVADIAAGTTMIIPGGGGRRVNSTLGGELVAFEDRSFHANSNASEIVVYDMATGATTRITDDDLMDINPFVSPSGNAVVFSKCETTSDGCDIYVATQTAPGVFTATALTGSEGDDRYPVTNGEVVVYLTWTSDGSHVASVPLAGGTRTILPVPGAPFAIPSIAGSLVAVVSGTPDDNDLYLYDIITGAAYQLTDTPEQEYLPDISVCNGMGRIVYQAAGAAGEFDILALTFTPPAPGTPVSLLDAKLEITQGGSINDDAFELDVVLALDGGSNGIDPLAEDVTLQIGPYTTTIPAGSFALDNLGRLAFEGIVDGVALEAAFWPVATGRYAFRAEAEGVELPGVANPVTVSLQVGNDGGSGSVTAEFR